MLISDPSSCSKAIDCQTETRQLAEVVLHHLIAKLPSRKWWFIPRDKVEAKAENSISSMLKLEFTDFLPIVLLVGILYEHKASNGDSSIISFDKKHWSQFDKDGLYQLTTVRPRINKKAGKTFNMICRSHGAIDSKPTPIGIGSVAKFSSPMPRSYLED